MLDGSESTDEDAIDELQMRCAIYFRDTHSPPLACAIVIHSFPYQSTGSIYHVNLVLDGTMSVPTYTRTIGYQSLNIPTRLHSLPDDANTHKNAYGHTPDPVVIRATHPIPSIAVCPSKAIVCSHTCTSLASLRLFT